jgi:hypothetical protein
MADPVVNRRAGRAAVDGISAGAFAVRIFWLALRLAAACVMIQKGSTFFYQGF